MNYCKLPRSERRTPLSNTAGWAMALGLALALAGCAGAGGGTGGGDGSGEGGDCNDGSWCGGILDRDRDNRISQGEWDGAFNAADVNGDGQLSQDEFARAGGSWG